MMVLDTDRPPLPAPTEPSTLDSADENNYTDDVDTNVSNRTDRTSYSVPDDGTPITINTTSPTKPRGQARLSRKFPSQTSLLIEYFESGKDEGQGQKRNAYAEHQWSSLGEEAAWKPTGWQAHRRYGNRSRHSGWRRPTRGGWPTDTP